MRQIDFTYTPRELAPYINYAYFFHAWGVKDDAALRRDAEAQLREWEGSVVGRGRVVLLTAQADGDDILLEGGERMCFLRQQRPNRDGTCLAWSDFVGGEMGLFVATCAAPVDGDPYKSLLCQTLADRLAEATAERLHEQVRRLTAPAERLTPAELFAEKYAGRRPAVGYPSLPDQCLNFQLARLLRFGELGVTLTESGCMQPHATTSGLIIPHPAARHFAIGRVSEEQLRDYARRRGEDAERLRRFVR